MTVARTWAVLAGLATLPAALAAQAPPPPPGGLPSAAQLQDRFLGAIGGRDAIAGQPGRYERGRFEIQSQGIRGTFELWMAPPNRQALRIELPGLGTITGGYDGEVGWSINPATGPSLLTGLQLDQTRQGADLHAALHPERYIARSETVADTVFEGRRSFKVLIETVWNERYHEFYDAETGLVTGVIRRQASPMGELEAVTLLEDWRPLGPLLQPRRQRQRLLGIEQLLVTDSIAVGTPRDSVFALPPEIRALRP